MTRQRWTTLTAALALGALVGCAGGVSAEEAASSAEGLGGGGRQGAQHGPPAAALAACNGLAAEAACSFTMNGNSLAGTCRATPRGMVCAGAGMGPGGPQGLGTGGPPPGAGPGAGGCGQACAGGAACGDGCGHRGGMGLGPGGHRGPPPESLAACSGLAADAACSFTVNGNALSGTCGTGPFGALHCMPTGGPGGGGRHGGMGMGPGGDRGPHGGMGPRGHRGPPEEALAACSGLAADAACSFTVNGRSLTGTCLTTRFGALVCRPTAPPSPSQP